MSVECQVNVKSRSELDIGGCETCFSLALFMKIIENELTSQVEETIIGLLDTCQNFLDEEKVKKSNYFSIKYFYNVDVLNT